MAVAVASAGKTHRVESASVLGPSVATARRLPAEHGCDHRHNKDPFEDGTDRCTIFLIALSEEWSLTPSAVSD